MCTIYSSPNNRHNQLFINTVKHQMILIFFHTKKAECQKIENVTEAFRDWPPRKVDADADDGQVGICKSSAATWHSGAKNLILWLFGWPFKNQTGPILLPSYPLTYIILHIKYWSNPIRILKLSWERWSVCGRCITMTKPYYPLPPSEYIRKGDTIRTDQPFLDSLMNLSQTLPIACLEL